MKFEIASSEASSLKERPIILKLVEDDSGIDLVVVRESGALLTYLLRVDEDGTIHRYSTILATLGFKTNVKGEIKINGIES